jgi:hypothetical protein
MTLQMYYGLIISNSSSEIESTYQATCIPITLNYKPLNIWFDIKTNVKEWNLLIGLI